jgi:hypothetical protein
MISYSVILIPRQVVFPAQGKRVPPPHPSPDPLKVHRSGTIFSVTVSFLSFPASSRMYRWSPT